MLHYVWEVSLGEGTIDGTARAGGGSEDNESAQFETPKLFRILYLFLPYHALLGYISEEKRDRLVQRTMLSLDRLDT